MVELGISLQRNLIISRCLGSLCLKYYHENVGYLEFIILCIRVGKKNSTYATEMVYVHICAKTLHWPITWLDSLCYPILS